MKQIRSGAIVLVVLVSCATAQAASGLALTVGLNKVDPTHYAGWEGELFACENDARDMAKIVKAKGFTVSTLLTGQATRSNVLRELQHAAQTLSSGDIFMLSFSGHGSQIFDENGDEKSNGPGDVLDETWCLFDAQLLDDEIYAAFRQFKPGVRVLMFSDSCHSGTVAKFAFYDSFASRKHPHAPFSSGSSFDAGELAEFFLKVNEDPKLELNLRASPSDPPAFRIMPLGVAKRTWVLNREFYEKIGRGNRSERDVLVSRGDEGEIAASGILVSGCQDNQFSKDGWLNGAFTGALKLVWEDARPAEVRSYRSFHQAIVERFSNDPSQTPNYYPFGATSPTFESQSPFSIE